MKIILTLLYLTVTALTFGQTQQIVKANDIKINGNIKLFTTKSEFINKIGKIEKIVEDFPGCSNYDEEASKGTKFFIYTKSGIKYYVYNKKADFQEINLKDNSENYILIGGYKISSKTTLAELKKIFPIAYKNYKREKDAYLLRLKFNPQWDDEIQIMIENRKVSTIYYWTPC